jgi:phosphoribosylformylglycinamidine synthase
LEEAGAAPERVHLNVFLRGEKQLEDYDLMVIPGGFSFGDDIASGKVMANQLLYRLRESLETFVLARKPLIGICNGFQVLVKCGLLPGLGGWDDKLSVTLTDNDSGKFECRWVQLQIGSPSFFTQGLPDTFPLPVAHGEGKFVTESKALFRRLRENGQVVLNYVKGENPNGSVGDVAGLCNAAGNILGLMPHPERYIFARQHPQWTRLSPLPKEGASPPGVGLQIFKNAVRYARTL